MRTPTIGDLLERRQRLEISCARCHREVVLSPEAAIALLGADTTFAEAEERLSCSGCGAQGRERLIDARPSMTDYYEQLRAKGLMGKR